MHPVETLLVPLGRAFRNRRADPTLGLAERPELASDARIALTSSAFTDGAEIPARYCGALIGPNVSPPLAWSALPEGTVDLLLVFEDIDSPGRTPHLHTVAGLAPTDDGLAEGALVPGEPGVRFLKLPARAAAYAGPRPLPGHGPHRYRFHLSALDTRIDLGAIADPEALVAAVAGHVLAIGNLNGTRTSG